jgi:primosomal protein N' (replication factor Y)
MNIAKIIISLSHSDIDKVYDYKIPSEFNNLAIGMEVEIPFGNQIITGFVVDITKESKIEEDRLKEIKNILHNGEVFLHPDQTDLASKVARYYLHTLTSAMNSMIPGGLTGFSRTLKKKKRTYLSINPGADLTSIRSNAYKQMEVIEVLQEEKRIEISKLKIKANLNNNQVINTLIDKGIVQTEIVDTYRKPMQSQVTVKEEDYELNYEQNEAIDKIFSLIINNKYKEVLLHGVTGSGKTDVYINAIKKCLSINKTAILLVPEIALTSQIVSRLRKHFSGNIAIMHSSLSQGERYDEWRRIFNGEIDIVVGARSAIFAPLKNIGVIIIDEEHEQTYKQDSRLRYDARKVASWRALDHDAVVILGSATPSLTSYYKSQIGEIELVELKKRVKQLPLPAFHVVDMKQEYKSGNVSLISSLLEEKLDYELSGGSRKAIILLNRRGFGYQLVCQGCGQTIKCPNCDITLTYHKTHNALRCHYCEYHMPFTTVCSECGDEIIALGEGIQKVHELLVERFPDTDVIRMDSDTTKVKNAHIKLLDKFKKSKRAILLGTQMIAKGLDIPDVNLVGIINADTSLNLPEYTADEKTFQLITQVAGRAGRGDRYGEVVVQTFNPDSVSIKLGCSQNYNDFYKMEIRHREKMQYPPFSQLLRVIAYHKEEKVAFRAVKFIENELNKMDRGKFRILGPSPAPINKLRNQYRWHIIIKVVDNNNLVLKEKLFSICQELRERGQSLEEKLTVIIDVDPESVM